ncbi:MAG: hypothetical protein JNK65_01225, partial [Deltaproteobacteria bacterium]|nr:hypothetical protein [Deltaproteobacteria bacterium]
MIQIKNLRIPYQKNPPLKKWVAEHLEKPIEQIATIQVLKQSLDARNPKQHFLIYHLEVFLEGESIEQKPIRYPQYQWNGPPPLIIGAGPAGLFAAWTFLAHGIRPILFERGERTHARMLKISRYWRKGELDLNSNVCNGEGGAGTFSDGKLITRIKSPLISQIMKILVDYGAPSEITYVYNPHVGSNLIREVIKRMSDDLIARGADLRFNTQVDHLDICSQQVQGLYLKKGEKISGSGLILACGHSAGDFLQTLYQQGIYFEVKSFALGLRIEHPQAYINSWQYGKHAISHHEGESAQYKLTHHWDTENIGVYSFCMCPGGYVISSTTDEKTLVVNGMSNFHRNSPWANAAIVCSIPKERFDQNDPFSLMKFQRELEQKTYFASKQEGDPKRIPVQRLEDFLLGKKGKIHTKS